VSESMGTLKRLLTYFGLGGLTKYIEAAMHQAVQVAGMEHGRIPDCQGAWANAETLEACRDELQEVLEVGSFGLLLSHTS